MLSGFLSLPLSHFILIGCVAIFTSLIGGVSGYGTGALMPLVLVPLVGPEPVVPIIAVSALLTNAGRILAFRHHISFRRVLIILVCAAPTCALGAFGYTLLTGRGVLIVIGTMLALSVPLRRLLKRRGFVLSEAGLAGAATGYGVMVGGTAGAGIVMLSMLIASGLAGAAVVATDATVSILIGIVKVGVFTAAGVVTPQVFAIGLLIGLIAFPLAFVAKWIVDLMPIHFHTAILDAVVVTGGVVMMIGAVTR